VGRARRADSLEQVAGPVDIDARLAGVAGAVDDRRHAGDREAFAVEELAGNPLGCGWPAGGSGSAAEHPDPVASDQQPRHHATAEGAGGTGYEDWFGHGRTSR
jgi:hypothetical protein